MFSQFIGYNKAASWCNPKLTIVHCGWLLSKKMKHSSLFPSDHGAGMAHMALPGLPVALPGSLTLLARVAWTSSMPGSICLTHGHTSSIITRTRSTKMVVRPTLVQQGWGWSCSSTLLACAIAVFRHSIWIFVDEKSGKPSWSTISWLARHHIWLCLVQS